MNFKLKINYQIRIIFFIALFSLSNFILLYSAIFSFNLLFILISLVISLYIVIKVYNLLNYSNRELVKFLQAIKYSDFSQNFNKLKVGGTFNKLAESFQDILTKLQETKKEKEENIKYLQTITQQIATGIITFTRDGNINLTNKSAKKIFNINKLTSINDLAKIDSKLPDELLGLKHNEKKIIRIYSDNEIQNIFIQNIEFKIKDTLYKLITLQNIQNELDEKEMEAWQKLIRVLTHEIMNSVTPISSLSDTMGTMIDSLNNRLVPECADVIEDLQSAIEVIKRRSDGLIKFVNKYRDLTRIPKPDFQIITIASLFNNIKTLYLNTVKEKNIKFETIINPPTLEIAADTELLEQVFINLVQNAIHAVGNLPSPYISLEAHLEERGKIVITVNDNGNGISEDILEKIFIPFFSTKPEGSGIGLSLSRQIIRAHGGTLTAVSQKGKTSFIIKF